MSSDESDGETAEKESQEVTKKTKTWRKKVQKKPKLGIYSLILKMNHKEL